MSRLCSFRSALRALHAGSPVYLALVCRVGDLPEGDAPGPSRGSSHSQLTPSWLGALRDEGTIPPSQLDALLKEFSDLFPEELPAGLPPDRGVSLTIPLEEGTKPVK